ncbi:MAG: glycosyltransferase [Nitrospira defluvii]|nr:glycosyltransferase [Nitrospira defluvii]
MLQIDESALPGFQVYRHGKWLPKFFKPRVLGRFTERFRLAQARQMLVNRGCEKIILYLWRPDFVSVLDEVTHDLSCYHIDDEYSFSTTEQPLDQREASLIARAGQVFIHSPALWDKKSHLNPNSLLVPNGVDYSRFATSQVEPDDLRSVSRPRMGYVGVIQSTINWSLLHELVKRHEEWSFIFVGPRGHLTTEDEAHIAHMSSLSHVHFLGGKPVEVLGAYAQNMNVCMMPYKINDYTKFIYPLKLHEYLASGRPTVGTPIRSLQDYGQVVKLATTADEWSVALMEALAPESSHPVQVESRRKVARTHDWATLVGRIAKTMCDRLGSPYRKGFASLLTERSS